MKFEADTGELKILKDAVKMVGSNGKFSDITGGNANRGR